MKSLFILIAALFPFLGFTGQKTHWIQEHIDVYPDFPKPGILFQSVMPLIRNPEAFEKVTQEFADRYQGQKIDAILGLEARGFIFGTALAQKLKVPFIPVRKSGKLPGKVIKTAYQKEYGSDSFEIEVGALKKGDTVVIIDDLIATGGTAIAACDLAARSGATVAEVACLVELPFLKAREKLPCPLFTLFEVDID